MSGTPALELKAIPAEYKVDHAGRIVEGYASTFGNVDLGGDVVEPGAYTKTLASEFPSRRIKVMRDHAHLIGLPLHMEQDAKGLFTRSKISATPLGDETLALAADGVIDSMSIGYRAEKSAAGQRNGRKVRLLQVVRLREYSLLADPMNTAAVITAVKSATDALTALRAIEDAPAELVADLDALVTAWKARTAPDAPASPSAPVAVSAPAPADVSAELASLLGDFRSFLAAVR